MDVSLVDTSKNTLNFPRDTTVSFLKALNNSYSQNGIGGKREVDS